MSLRVGVGSVSLALVLAGSQAWSADPVQRPAMPVNPAVCQYPYQGPGYCPPCAPGYPQQPGQPPAQPMTPGGQPPAGQAPTTPGQQPTPPASVTAPEAMGQAAATGIGQGFGAGAGGFSFDFGGSDAVASGGTTPGMLGDFIGYTGTRVATVRSNFAQVVTQQIPNGFGGYQTVQILYGEGDPILVSVPGAPIASRVAFKIIENESPEPQDRAYLRFNYYHDALRSLQSGTDASNFSFIRRIDLYRETLGLEKTLFCPDFSVGLRVPFLQVSQTDGTNPFGLTPGLSFDASDIGDVTVILKLVIARDCETGSLISGGVAFTFPTGPATFVVRSDQPLVRPISGSFSSFSGPIPSSELVLAQDPRDTSTTLVQPWAGFYLELGFGYVQGFSSVILPIAGNDIKLLSNSIALGYYLNPLMTPTIEFHLTTPLESTGFFGDPIGMPDLLVMTLGSHFHLTEMCDFTIGAGIPLTGDKLYDIQGLAELTFRF